MKSITWGDDIYRAILLNTFCILSKSYLLGPGKNWSDSEAAHEARLPGLLGLKSGMKALDVGCGVGGPMRTIASTSGAEVTGITINEYQVKRGEYHNKKVSPQHLYWLCNASQSSCDRLAPRILVAWLAMMIWSLDYVGCISYDLYL